jgi:hypothetical protein
VIGSPVTAGVSAGSAGATYTLPAGTAGGVYTIRAAYSGTANFAASSDATHTLTVSPVATTTTATSASTTYTVAGQLVNLGATVTSSAGVVGEGTLTFTVLSGATVVGSPATVGISGGSAGIGYSLPAGTAAGTYTVRAVYNGTANLATSTDATQTLTITSTGTTTAATSTTTTFTTAGRAITLSAAVTSPAGTVGQGTATFTVLSGATVIGNPVTVGVTAGAAAATYVLPAGTPTGTYTIQANYNGTASLDTSSDATRTLTITSAATTATAMTVSTAYTFGGQSVGLAATITSPAGSVDEGTATFTVLSGAAVVGTPVTVNVAGGSAAAGYALPAGTAAGTYTIRVAYSGTGNLNSSADATHTLTVTPAATVTSTASVSTTFSTAPRSINLAATVTSAAGVVGEGTETFTILSGAAVVGTPITVSVLGGAAAATYALPAGIPVGTYTIRAVYNGTASLGTSSDTGQQLTVGTAGTTTAAAAASTAYSTFAQSINLAATVSSPAGVVGAGTVTFVVLNGATVVGSPAVVNVAGGTAAAAYTLPAGTPAGTYTIRADYAGTADLTPSTDATHSLTVAQVGTTTAAADATAALSDGAQTVALTAVVTSAAGFVSVGAATFTVRSGAAVVGTPVTVNVVGGSAAAGYALPAGTPTGTYTIQVAYSGTANLGASTDTAHTLTVNLTTMPTTVMAASASTPFSTSGGSVNLGALVTSADGPVDEGTLTFTVLDGATVIGTPVSVGVSAGSAAASYVLPAGSPAGTYTIRAAYGGTADFGASTDATHTLTVTPAAVTAVVTGTSVTGGSGPQTISLPVTLDSSGGTVTGGSVTITVLSGGTTVGTPITVPVVNGGAAVSYTLPANTPAGLYTIRVVFSGAAGFAGFTDTTQLLTVVPNPVRVGAGPFAVGADAGGSGTVTEYNPIGSAAASFDPFPGFAGGVRTSVADFNGDGTADVATATGPGATAAVTVFDGRTRVVLFDARPFEEFTGGVFVAAGDVTGDGRADLVVTPDVSGGPRISVFRGGDFARVANFFTFTDDPNFRGGARAAGGDVNGDGFADLVISAGFGGGPRIAVYDGRELAGGREVHLVPDFFLFEPALRNGAYVAAGDVDGDGFADVIGGGGPGGGPRVLVVSGRRLLSAGAVAAIDAPVANFFAGDTENRGGIRVAAKNLDGDDRGDVVAGAGTGAGSRVTAYLGAVLSAGSTVAELSFDAFPGFPGGVFVG